MFHLAVSHKPFNGEVTLVSPSLHIELAYVPASTCPGVINTPVSMLVRHRRLYIDAVCETQHGFITNSMCCLVLTSVYFITILIH